MSPHSSPPSPRTRCCEVMAWACAWCCGAWRSKHCASAGGRGVPAPTTLQMRKRRLLRKTSLNPCSPWMRTCVLWVCVRVARAHAGGDPSGGCAACCCAVQLRRMTVVSTRTRRCMLTAWARQRTAKPAAKAIVQRRPFTRRYATVHWVLGGIHRHDVLEGGRLVELIDPVNCHHLVGDKSSDVPVQPHEVAR